jgi:hypothetical protein
MNKVIINLSPCSSAPSSPTSEVDEIDSAFEAMSIRSTEQPPPDPTVPNMVSSLKHIWQTKAPKPLVAQLEDALIGRLHHVAATLTDVEAMIPVLNNNFRVIYKLATNIGLYHARNQISDADVEAMLIHILTHGDKHNKVFERTKDQIERFRVEKEQRRLQPMTNIQRIKYFQRQENIRQQHLKQEEKKALERRRSVPAEYHQPAQYMPGGGSSLADVITEVDGLTWSQMQTVRKYAGIEDLPLTTKMAAITTTTLTDTKPDAPSGSEPDVSGTGEFALTRAHHAVGWPNRSKLKVKLPHMAEEVDVHYHRAQARKKAKALWLKLEELYIVQARTTLPPIKVVLPQPEDGPVAPQSRR